MLGNVETCLVHDGGLSRRLLRRVAKAAPTPPPAPDGTPLSGPVDARDASTRVVRGLWMRGDSLQQAGRAESARAVFAFTLRQMSGDHPLSEKTAKAVAELDEAIGAAEAAREAELRAEARARGLDAGAPSLHGIESSSRRAVRAMAARPGATDADRAMAAAADAREAAAGSKPSVSGAGAASSATTDDDDDDEEEGGGGGGGSGGDAMVTMPAVVAAMLAASRRLPAEQGTTAPPPVPPPSDAAPAAAAPGADASLPLPPPPPPSDQAARAATLLGQYASLGHRPDQALYLVSSEWWSSWCAWSGYGSGATAGAPLAPARAEAEAEAGAEAEGGMSSGAADGGATPTSPSPPSPPAGPPGPVSNGPIAGRRYRVHGSDAASLEAEAVEGEDDGAPVGADGSADYTCLRRGLHIAGAPTEAAAMGGKAGPGGAEAVAGSDVVAVGEQVWRALVAWHGGGPCLPRVLRDVRVLETSFSAPDVAAPAASAPAPAAAAPPRALKPPLGSPEYLLLDAYPEARAEAAELARSAELVRAASLATAGPGGAAEPGSAVASLARDGCCPYLPGTTLPVGPLPGGAWGFGAPSQAEATALPRRSWALHPAAVPLAERAATAFSEPPERFAQRGATGLRNVGNTCFLNSAAQCLSACWPLTSWALRGGELQELNRSNALGTGGALAREWGHLLRVLWTHEDVARRGGVAPRGLKDAVGRFRSQFRGFRQHDAHELLSFLLDGLHEDCNRVLAKPYLAAPEGLGAGGEAALARATWRWYQARNRSAVSATMAGLLRSQLDCPGCGNRSVKFEPFTSLQLPLAAPSSFLVAARVALRPRAPAGPGSSRRAVTYRCEAGEGLGADGPGAEAAEDAAAAAEAAAAEDGAAASASASSAGPAAAPAAGGASAGYREARTTTRVVVVSAEPGTTVGDVRALVARKLAEAEPWLCPGGADVDAAAESLRARLLCFEPARGLVSRLAGDAEPVRPAVSRRGGLPTASLYFAECLQAADGSDGATVPAGAAAEAEAFGDAGPDHGSAGGSASVMVEVRLLIGTSRWVPADGVAALQPRGCPLVLSVPARSTALGVRLRVAASLAHALRSDVAVSQLGAAPGADRPAAARAAGPGRSTAEHVRNVASALRFVIPACKPGGGAPPPHPSDPASLPADGTPFLAAVPPAPTPAGRPGVPPWAGIGVVLAGPWVDGLDVAALTAAAAPGPLAAANAAARRAAAGACVSIDDCLRGFAAPERLGAGNEWFCPACRAHVRATKSMSLWSCPDVLSVQLSRFTSHGVLFKSKISTDVTFPASGLDLAPAMAPGAARAAEDEDAAAAGALHPDGAERGDVGAAEAQPEAGAAGPAAATASADGAAAAPSPACRLYDLFGVVRHHGSMQGGHYTAHASRYVARYGARAEGGGGGGTLAADPLGLDGGPALCAPHLADPALAAASWHSFDDDRVRPAAEEEAAGPGDAYLLFFRRRGLVAP